MPKAKEKELKNPNISRFSAPFEVSYQYLFFLLRMYLYNTRNQVVAQAARGFESHPVRQKSLYVFKREGFSLFCQHFVNKSYFKSGKIDV